MAWNGLFELVTTYNLAFHRGCRLRQERLRNTPLT
jgi:hypothetical protein